MSFFSSLYSSASGMLAFSNANNIVSQNVANVSTIGYKRSDVSFKDSIFSTKGNNTDTLAGVRASRLLRADSDGAVQQTSSRTDASITGRGFFAVKRTISDTDEFFFTRNGQFGEFVIRSTPDTGAFTTENTGESTYLRNSAGYYLYGWPVDQSGNVVGSDSLDTLVPIEVGIFETQALPTSQIDLTVNLDSSEDAYDPHRLSPTQTLPVSSEEAHFNRSVTVYDNNGAERQVSFQFRKIVGPMAHFTSGVNSQLERDDVLVNTGEITDIPAGSVFTIGNTGGAGPISSLNITFVDGPANTANNEANTLQDVIDVINNHTSGGAQQFEARVKNGQLLVQAVDPTHTLLINGSDAAVLGVNGFNFVTDPADGDYQYAPDFDITATDYTGSAYPNQADWPGFTNTATPNTQGWWEAVVLIPDPADPTGSTLVELSSGLLNFDRSGLMNTADGTLSLASIDFDASATGEELDIAVDISRFTQFSNNYNVLEATQDGAGVGQRSGVTIQEDGTVTALFNNGIEIDIYRIPLAVFANPNGLRELSDTVFGISGDSGDVSLLEADTQGAGSINPSTIENSNVDLSNEFGNLIVNQKGFQLNSRVVTTTDEMMSVLSQLSR